MSIRGVDLRQELRQKSIGESALELREILVSGYHECPAPSERLLVFQYKRKLLCGNLGHDASDLTLQPFATNTCAVGWDIEALLV